MSVWRALFFAALSVGLSACEPSNTVAPALRALVGEKPVVLLSASWCGYCKKARADFRAWGVDFREYDVETSDIGRRAYAEIGARGVPILLIREHQLYGYSSARVRGLLEEAGALPMPAPPATHSVSP